MTAVGFTPAHAAGGKKFDWVTVLLVVAGIALVVFSLWRAWFLVSSQVEQEQANRAAIERTAETVSSWPSEEQKAALSEAEDYNATIDPATHDLNLDHEGSDAHYFDVLDLGDGVMGSISIPSISAEIPIRHGSSDDVLAAGAGHLWGTDLPLGEDGDFSVVSGHSGAVHGLFFTRVPELRKGDLFYVTVLGKETGYRIDKIESVAPDDTEALRRLYSPGGKARVTLVTCVPVGVNTSRLLVSGVAMDDVPPSSQAPGDPLWPWGLCFAIGGVVLLVLLIALVRALVKRRRQRGRHVL